MLRILSVLFASVLLGCSAEQGPDCGGHFRLDGTLTAPERARLQVAADKWNGLAQRNVVTFDDAATCVVSVREHENLGTWRGKTGELELSPLRMHDQAPGCAERMGDCIEAVALHELGHALGLEHVEGGGHVMSADGELLEDFTPSDVEECKRAGVCG